MTDAEGEAMRALAKGFVDCMEAGDMDALLNFYAPDARIWHNTDGLEQTPEENVQQLAGSGTRVVDRAYVDRHVEVFPTGFVHQHVLRGTRTHDDVQVEMPACLVCRVADGKITRLDGYLDSARVAEFAKYA